jgi:hypothetical protein
MRRHWLKTTTLRFCVITRLLTNSRNSLSLGAASDSINLGVGVRRRRSGHVSLKLS